MSVRKLLPQHLFSACQYLSNKGITEKATQRDKTRMQRRC